VSGWHDISTAARIAFVVYALMAVLGGCWAVTARSLVRAMIGLVVTLFAVAGVYLLLMAEFVALMQILIYAGAVSVLIFFAIMLTEAGAEDVGPNKRGLLRAGLASAAPTTFLLLLLARYGEAGSTHPQEVATAALGTSLLGPYTLAFELISIALLAAAVGAVLLTLSARGRQ